MDGFIVKRVSKLVAMKEVQSVRSVMCRLQMVACSGVVVPGEVSTLTNCSSCGPASAKLESPSFFQKKVLKS